MNLDEDIRAYVNKFLTNPEYPFEIAAERIMIPDAFDKKAGNLSRHQDIGFVYRVNADNSETFYIEEYWDENNSDISNYYEAYVANDRPWQYTRQNINSAFSNNPDFIPKFMKDHHYDEITVVDYGYDVELYEYRKGPGPYDQKKLSDYTSSIWVEIREGSPLIPAGKYYYDENYLGTPGHLEILGYYEGY
jgi:hypothetical protein